MAGKNGMKLNKNHEDSPRFIEYWKKENPNWTIEQCEEKANWFKKSCNYQCIEYYERNYPELSHEEHLRLKNQLQEQRRQNKDTNIEYWKKRYPEKSLEELEKLRSKASKQKNKCNIEYWEKRYPEKTIDEIKKMHQDFFQTWLSHQEGWGKGDKNPNSKNNSTQKERNSRSPKCIEFYERKYPELSHEEHLKMLQEQYDKTNNTTKSNYNYNTTIEYYLNKGMSEEDAIKALHDRQKTFTFKKCIQKYGEEKGEKIFKERQQKWVKSLCKSLNQHHNLTSLSSKIADDLIYNICLKLSIEIPNYEQVLIDVKKDISYAYDFCYNNKIIEFNGDYWHCNPKIYKENFYNKSKHKTAKEIWKYDNQKIKLARKQGFDVLVIWESDYRNNKENIINKCYEFLTS